MRRFRRTLAVLVLMGMATMPLPGCAGGGGQQIMGLLMGLGVSVGSYYLVNEL